MRNTTMRGRSCATGARPEELAILGGPKAVTLDVGDQWRRPVEEEKAAVCGLIDHGELSGAGRSC